MKYLDYWHKFLKKVIPVMFMIIIIFYLIQCQLYQYIHPQFKMSIILPIVVIAIYYLLYKIFYKVELKSSRRYKIILFFVSILCYGIYGIYAKTAPVSDYEVLINGAKAMVNGDFPSLSFDKTNYFYFYNFQTGYVVYLAMIMKIFGQRLMFLKIVEIIIMSLTNVLVYDVVSKVYSRKSGVIASLMYAVLLFNIAGSSIINNQHIATFFVILALWLFMRNKISTYVLSGLLIGIAMILRPSVIVVAMGCFAFLMWKLLKNDFKKTTRSLIILFLMAVSVFGIVKIFDLMMIKKEIVPNSAVDGNATYFKFMLGLKGEGLYNIPTKNAEKTQVYFDLSKLDFNYQRYNDECKKSILELCKNDFRTIIDFVSNKMILFCGAEDNQIEFAGDSIQRGALAKFMNYYGYVQYILLLVLAVIYSVLFIFKEDKLKYEGKEECWNNLFLIVFILFFIAHVFIEVQARYRYEQYLMLTIISAPVLSIIFNKIDEGIKKFKEANIKYNFKI